MFDWVNAETPWIVTNQIMGIVTLVCGFIIVRDIVRGVRLQLEPKAKRVALDDHAFEMPGLGLTMADGGTPRARKDPASPEEKKKAES